MTGSRLRPRPAAVAACAALLGTLTAAGGSSPATAATAAAVSAPPGAVADCLLPPASCYSPGQFRVAYGIQPLLDAGIDGRGETVTVLDPVPSPTASPPGATDIRQDLARFDTAFHLPAARIRVVTSLAGQASPWRATLEEAEDIEIVHAVAPAAIIRVVLMPATVLDSAANATADMLAGLRLAVSRTDVASISWSLGEHLFSPGQVAQMHSVLRAAAARHVTVTASSGDHGRASDPWFGNAPVREVSLPASDPLVLAAGGTTLTAGRPAGAYAGETAWHAPAVKGRNSGGSGGGFSRLYGCPGYQDCIAGTGRTRGVPDVAGDADPQAGMTLAVSDGSQKYILGSASGTSASAPLWAGLAALADQYAHHDLGFINPAVYTIARGPLYHRAFHDITTGNNTATIGSVTVSGNRAVPGWDPVTGWGTPDAQALIPLLAKVTAKSGLSANGAP